MDALAALHNRVSSGLLTEPAPTDQQREGIFRAALRAADHGCLHPWRFLLVEGEARNRLGELFLHASEQNPPDPLTDVQRERIKAMPLRAPLILVAITCLQENPRVPHIEQRMSTAAAIQAILTAAFAMEVGAYWRTGALASNPLVAEGLGLADNERIDGFVYLGTPQKEPRQAPELAVSDYFTAWNEQ